MRSRPAAPAPQVVAPDGTRYFTDQQAHGLVIELPGAARRFVGGPGARAGEFFYPLGLALVPGATVDAHRLYVCDAWNHRMQVLDGRGRPLGAFGRHGDAPGQFDVPSDVAVVQPKLPGEPLDFEGNRLLAVADRWNGRIQIFDLDGALVATFGLRAPQGDAVDSARWNGLDLRGWPYCRLGHDPVIPFPTHVGWRPPFLDITCAEGVFLVVHLAHAMMPPFETWRRTASAAERRAARRHFRGLLESSDVALAGIVRELDADLEIRRWIRSLG